MTTVTVRVRDFTTIPGGRFIIIGEGSAEEFYNDYVFPAIKDSHPDKLVIDCNGTWGYPPSFVSQLVIYLSEFFGGRKTLKKILEVVADGDPEALEQFKLALDGKLK